MTWNVVLISDKTKRTSQSTVTIVTDDTDSQARGRAWPWPGSFNTGWARQSIKSINHYFLPMECCQAKAVVAALTAKMVIQLTKLLFTSTYPVT